MSTRRFESEQASRRESKQEKGKDPANSDGIYRNMRSKYRSHSPDTSGHDDRNQRSRHRSPKSDHNDMTLGSTHRSGSPEKSGFYTRDSVRTCRSGYPDNVGREDRSACSRFISRSPDKLDSIRRSPKYASLSADKIRHGDKTSRARHKSRSPDESGAGYADRASLRNEDYRSRKRNAMERFSSVGSLPPEGKRGFLSEGRKDHSQLLQNVADQNTLPDLYSIQKGKVRSIRPYGVFVNLYNCRNNGLVHLSQISNHEITNKDDTDELKVQAIGSVVEEGEEVWVKVISIKHEEDGSVKLGCSLKYVSQSDGRDLDPTNVQLDQQLSRPTWQAPSKLVLDAVYNITCTRCGGHGHLKKECYSTGDKVYELLTEDDAVETVEPNLLEGIRQGIVSVSRQETSKPANKVPAASALRLKTDRSERLDVNRSLKSRRQPLPEKVTTIEEALAVITSLKDEKRRKKKKRKEKEKRHKHREGKKHKRKDASLRE